MSISSSLIGELRSESKSTRKILERVPFEHRDWKPHEKSMTLARLATHIAQLNRWVYTAIEHDEFVFQPSGNVIDIAASLPELLGIFEDHLAKALYALENCPEEDFEKTWTVKRGDRVIYQPTKKLAIRQWGFNHTYHHRGQLTVFLRLLNVPVPGMYGPTADER
jgi:uncharacterized damage-inducible protein DinB